MFWITALITVILDQVSKYIVASSMELNSDIGLIPGVLDLTFIRNDGAAWGMLSGRQTLLIVATSIVIVLIMVYASVKKGELSRLELLALGLIAGGGLGNLISRIAEGAVVDFLNIHLIPIFNVADIGVTVGCVFIVISLFASDNGKTDI